MYNEVTIYENDWLKYEQGYVDVPECHFAAQVRVSDWVSDILEGKDEDRAREQMRKILYGN